MTRTKSFNKLLVMVVCIAMMLSFTVLSASALTEQIGEFVNDSLYDSNGDPVYFYTLAGAPSPHGNNVVNSYDLVDNGSGGYDAYVYFQQGSVTPPYPPNAPTVDVVVEDIASSGSFDTSTGILYISNVTYETPVTLYFFYPGTGSHPGGQDFILKLDELA